MANAKKLASYPTSDCPKRPFHLWNPQTNRRIPYRFYGDRIRAFNGALIEAKWELHPGQSIEVIDVRVGRLLAVYTRRATTLDIKEF